MVYLSKGNLSAAISEAGAELKSFKKDGEEYIWCGDPAVWSGTAPILFPIVCTLKDNTYTLDGKAYNLNPHGFAKDAAFAVESASDDSATFLLTHSEGTLEVYPFEFEFRVIFTLTDTSLTVEYKVNNLNDREMYFSVGAHEAYATPGGVEDYDLIFEHKENLDTVLLNGRVLSENTMTVGKNTEYLPIYEKYFALDTLIFKNLKSHSVILKNRKTERAVKVDFPHCNYIGIWHKPDAPYLCIEPWAGIPDNDNTDGNIKTKEGIVTLAPRGEYRNIHTITVL